jgi:hypothetical protein
LSEAQKNQVRLGHISSSCPFPLSIHIFFFFSFNFILSYFFLFWFISSLLLFLCCLKLRGTHLCQETSGNISSGSAGINSSSKNNNDNNKNNSNNNLVLKKLGLILCFKVGQIFNSFKKPCGLQVFKVVRSLQQLQFCFNKCHLIYKIKDLFEVYCHADLS